MFRPILFSAGYGNPAYTHVHMHRNVGRVSYATQSMAETMINAIFQLISDMIFKELPLKDAFIVESESHSDSRGVFSRIFCQEEFKKIGIVKQILQINHSMTVNKGAIRGMHFQYPPKAEIKMVKCIHGAVFDVIVDLRKGSETLLKWHGETLNPENMKMIYIPEGFAHGFQVLEDNSELIYFHTELYSLEHEGAIRYDDPNIGIDWPIEITDVSARDKNHALLGDNFTGLEI